MRRNLVKQKLAAGEVAVGVTLSFLHPGLAEYLGLLGFDFLVVDGEHGSISDEAIENVTRAGDLTGAATVIRLPLDGPALRRYLDIGVSGVQIPYLRSGAEAAAVVDAVKYGPLGGRGLTLGRVTDYGLMSESAPEFIEASNDETLTMIQIEDTEGVDALPAILAVEGIDVVLVGPLDLSDSLGVTGEMNHPTVLAAIDEIVRQTVEVGKVAGLPAGDAQGARDAIRRGARLLLTSVTSSLGPSASAFLDAARSETASRVAGPV